ncbi:MAG: DUF6603 domain-containing protein [Marinilabilia sp.]
MAASNAGTIELIAIQFASVLTALKEKLDSGNARTVFGEMGVQFPPDLDSNSEFNTALAALITKINELPELTGDLVSAIKAEDYGKVTTKSLNVIANLKNSIEKFSEISSAIETYANSKPGAEKTLFMQFAAELPEKLLSYALISELEEKTPVVAQTLEFFDIIKSTDKNVGSTDPLKPPYTEKLLNPGRVGSVLSKPDDLLKELYSWGDHSFDEKELLEKINNVLIAGNLPAILDDSIDPPVLDMILLEILPERIPDKPDGLILKLADSFNQTFNVDGEGWDLELSSSITAPTNTRVLIEPGGNLTFTPPTASEIEGETKLTLGISSPTSNEPYIVVGKANSSRLEFQKITIGLGSNFIWDDSSNTSKGVFQANMGIEKLNIVLSTEGADGFIAKVLPLNSEAEFDLDMGYSSDTGLYIKGSAAIEIQLPLHLSLGPVQIPALLLALKLKDEEFPLELGANFKFDFGPLNVVVENMGMSATFSFPEPKGNLGPLQLDLGFKPPKGVGLAIDAGVVKGGGFLYFDYEKEEYGGAMELTFSDFLSLKAIGVIAPKMPDGSSGFSMLIIITAEFTIQLGMGFVFLGAGGLLGLHRSAKLTPLAEGVRSGATANILFPENVVENAPKIISDIKIFFPILQNYFLIGPMVKLGWGQPPLISIALGIIIEIRTDEGGSLERIAILGTLKCILPEEKSALLVLQVNFIGAVDFTKKSGFFFASIFESRVLFITIEGEMGLLVAWGDDPDFLVSVGGFHPRFNPPPLPFPVPKRVSLNILNESWGKIRVQGYFAVTTNTVQFGTKMELYFGFSEFKIEGHLAFDALFQFNPFYFIIDISGKVSLKVFGVDSFSISLKFTLEGTSPWRAKGYGKIKILFFSFKARFDETWGESKNTSLPPIEIIPILRAELNELQNWQSIAPKSNQLLVTLRDLPKPEEGTPAGLTLHPVGTLRVSQRRIPLRIKLDKIGSQKPADAGKLDFEPSGAFKLLKTHRESFARAQFQDMKDSKKLSSPSFEKEVGGLDLSVSGDQMRFGNITVRHVRYELHTIDTAYKRFTKRFFSMLQILFVKFLGNNAAGKSQLSHKVQKEFKPFDDKIEVLPGAYTVALTRDNKPLSAEAVNFTSMAGADQYISEILANDPNMADAIHTIPNNEVNHAA